MNPQFPKINYIEIIDRIGEGGTANVFKGVDLNYGTLVAVKVLSGNLFKNEKIREKLIEEAQRYLDLSHKGIVGLKDFIKNNDNYYLIMEFIEGQNLETHINKTTGPIPEQRALEMMVEILEAMAYAHKHNVLHLDIKPSNIMISNRKEIKILDFGISSDISDDTNSVELGGPIGTPYYMSPEQIDGKNIDKRSDIYSLGITLFQMLTGTVPFLGNYTREELFKKIKEGKLLKAKEIYPFVSDEVQIIIDKATHVDKQKRFKTIDEFIDAINET
jgi:serine/threonine protein kinase